MINGQENNQSELAFYLCNEAGDQIEKIGEVKQGRNFSYLGCKGDELCYSVDKSETLQMDLHYYIFNTVTGKTKETTGKKSLNYIIAFGPEK